MASHYASFKEELKGKLGGFCFFSATKEQTFITPGMSIARFGALGLGHLDPKKKREGSAQPPHAW